MGASHSRGVTRNRLRIENALDDGYWQDVFTEEEYFENDVSPIGPHPDDKGRVKGEFDVLAVNYEDKVALYVEVKTNRGDLYKAEKQLERAEDHFDEYGWDVLTQKYLED